MEKLKHTQCTKISSRCFQVPSLSLRAARAAAALLVSPPQSRRPVVLTCRATLSSAPE